MQPDVWGKYLWISIHYIALGYPRIPTADEKIAYSHFFSALAFVIPCKLCSNHYTKMLMKLPLTDDILENNETLFKWTVDIHNLVNIETNTKQMSYKDAFLLYTKTLEKHNSSIKDVLNGLIDTPTYVSTALTRRILIMINILIVAMVGWMVLSKRSSRKLF